MKKIPKINSYIAKILSDEKIADRVLEYAKDHPDLATFLLKYISSYEKNIQNDKITIRSSVALDQDTENKIVNLLSGTVSGLEVESTPDLDESGFVATYNNRMIDGRLLHFQNKLALHLLNTA